MNQPQPTPRGRAPRFDSDRGATATQYVLLVALIAVVCVATAWLVWDRLVASAAAALPLA